MAAEVGENENRGEIIERPAADLGTREDDRSNRGLVPWLRRRCDPALKVRVIGDRVVVEHDLKRRTAHDLKHLHFHLAVVALVDLGRKGHEAPTSQGLRFISQNHRLFCRQRGDSRNDGDLILNGLSESRDDGKPLFKLKSYSLTQRPE